MKSQGNKTSLMECNNFQKLDTPKQGRSVICLINKSKYIIVILRKPKELQEGQFNKIRENIVNKIRNSNRGNYKKNQIIQLKNECMK